MAKNSIPRTLRVVESTAVAAAHASPAQEHEFFSETEPEEKTIVLTAEAAADIRRALAIGLACYGEVERVRDVFQVLDSGGDSEAMRELCPIHPSGTYEIGSFATALLWLDDSRGAA